MKSQKKKVLIALSGGIDSAVSAHLLLKKGYKVEAAFMRNWSSTAGLKVQDCPWLKDRQDALRVAAFLHIPLHTLDFEQQYADTVMKYFFDEYKKGRTPNPDVMCNKEIKFKLLYNWAMRNEFDYLATGHYARVGTAIGRPRLKHGQPISGQPTDGQPMAGPTLQRSADEFKDQTYFIYNIKTEQLPHILFPIGGMKKTAVRSLARKLKLPNAEKRESMGLCFVGKIRLKDFLEQKLKASVGQIVLMPTASLRGGVRPTTKQSTHKNQKKIAASARQSPQLRQGFVGQAGLLAMTETVIGQHHGLHNYTIGQRQGINVGGGGPYYVVKKDLKSNTLYVTNDPNDKALMVKEVQVHSLNWISNVAQAPGLPNNQGTALHYTGSAVAQAPGLPNKQGTALHYTGSAQLLGRYRHQGKLVPLSIRQIKRDLYQVIFKTPQKAVASGQSLVLYRGKECVGGGIIG